MVPRGGTLKDKHDIDNTNYFMSSPLLVPTGLPTYISANVLRRDLAKRPFGSRSARERLKPYASLNEGPQVEGVYRGIIAVDDHNYRLDFP
jgi:hypothetical protein